MNNEIISLQKNELGALIEKTIFEELFNCVKDIKTQEMMGQAYISWKSSIKEKGNIVEYLKSRYPDLKYDDAVWADFSDEEKRRTVLNGSFMKIIKKFIGIIAEEVERVVNERQVENLEDLINSACKLFVLFIMECKVDNLRNSNTNNELLAKLAVEVALNREIVLWRFVCFPEIYLRGNNSPEWDYTIGYGDYNTLTPALNADGRLLEKFNKLGISTELVFIVDDWETPYLRVRDDFYKLDQKTRAGLLNELQIVRDKFDKWIRERCQQSKVDYSNIKYFSDFIDYTEFADLLDAYSIESDAEYKNLFNAEIEFCRKFYPEATDFQINSQARIRIIQYAVEGSILKGFLPLNSLYLNSEYPVQNVWKKLTLSAEIPTLFYVTDQEVKNF